MRATKIIVEPYWKNFYTFAGLAALLIVAAGIADTILSMVAGEAAPNHAVPATEWFHLFETNPITALSNLGLINIITLSLGIPVYLALLHVHRQTNPAFAGLAATLYFIGVAIYISSNTVFSMLAISSQYALASDSQRVFLEEAARAALAQGADLTPGTFMGLGYTQLGGLIMALILLRAGVFSKKTAWPGILGFTCMLIFFTLAAFSPQLFSTAMLTSLIGGLALMIYHILIAFRLFSAQSA